LEADTEPPPERREPRDPVVQVLKDVFGVFDREDRRPRVRRRAPDLSFFLPQPNTRKKRKNPDSLFEKLRKRPRHER
jgi:hypothetical protein